MSNAADITALLRRAFLEGFKVSGEGWNGEYPYEGVPDPEIMDVLEEYFQRAFPVGGQDESHG
jgi:hypothetical protein